MKVLIADDSPVLVTALRKLLEQSGYEVVAAMDGLEAVQRFYQENPDLVLLDIQRPLRRAGTFSLDLIEDEF